MWRISALLGSHRRAGGHAQLSWAVSAEAPRHSSGRHGSSIMQALTLSRLSGVRKDAVRAEKKVRNQGRPGGTRSIVGCDVGSSDSYPSYSFIAVATVWCSCPLAGPDKLTSNVFNLCISLQTHSKSQWNLLRVLLSLPAHTSCYKVCVIWEEHSSAFSLKEAIFFIPSVF